MTSAAPWYHPAAAEGQVRLVGLAVDVDHERASPRCPSSRQVAAALHRARAPGLRRFSVDSAHATERRPRTRMRSCRRASGRPRTPSELPLDEGPRLRLHKQVDFERRGRLAGLRALAIEN